ncbi:HD domain-containing protein [Halobaculum sp. EA56]|uniref:HD domain-containing protein n=1 Tax=Halobaculum sp. EA56 TaxID=3421648 RepID=UPI003EC00B2B
MDSVLDLLCEMADVPAGPEEYHAEGSVLQHTLLVAEEMAHLNPDDPVATLMAVTHDIGKIATPTDDLPNHYGHDERGAEVIAALPDPLLSAEARQIATLAAEQHMRFKKLPEMRASKAIRLVTTLDEAGVTAERMRDLVIADRRGRVPQRPIDEAALNDCIDAVRTAKAELDEDEIANEQHRLQEEIRSYRESRDGGLDE